MSVLILTLGIGLLIFLWKLLGVVGVLLGFVVYILFWLALGAGWDVYKTKYGTEEDRSAQFIQYSLHELRKRTSSTHEKGTTFDEYKENTGELAFFSFLGFLSGAITLIFIILRGWDFADRILDLGSGIGANLVTALLSWMVVFVAVIIAGGAVFILGFIIVFAAKDLFSFIRNKVSH